ncbi:polysaccharide biosynthesis/export family protein [Mesorhizobium sp. KR1-2]|uniref:polysaccharide biosynthesis/export family protein n=1 Tax=Mesorhizobium sp. KR1-2 TaxID=3156609 RepID=UPI0032B3FC89
MNAWSQAVAPGNQTLVPAQPDYPQLTLWGTLPMVPIHRASFARFVAGTLFVAALLAAISPARGEILIERGDTLHVLIAEAPKLGGDSKVDLEGNIVLPQLGNIRVAGMRLDDVRARLQEELVKREILKSPTVLVEIAKYRPFYVGGNVRRPGAVEYEPGLTVRHALILAGGAGLAEQDHQLSLDIPSLRAKWKTGSYQLFQINSRIARLEAELSRDERAKPEVASGSVAPQDAEALLSLDQKILRDRLGTWSGNQAHLREGMALLDLEIDVLKQQGGLQEKERDLGRAQVEAARTLVAKGLMPLPRLLELEREDSKASRDLLENQAYTARARQNRATVENELSTADFTWRIDIHQQLRDAMLDRVRLKAEMDALSAQILDAGTAVETDVRQAETIVVIYRSMAGHQETVKARMDTEILPGDILDVSLSMGAAG